MQYICSFTPCEEAILIFDQLVKNQTARRIANEGKTRIQLKFTKTLSER